MNKLVFELSNQKNITVQNSLKNNNEENKIEKIELQKENEINISPIGNALETKKNDFCSKCSNKIK